MGWYRGAKAACTTGRRRPAGSVAVAMAALAGALFLAPATASAWASGPSSIAADTVPLPGGDEETHPAGSLPDEMAALHRGIADLLGRYGEMDGLRDVQVRLGRDTLRLSGLALDEGSRARAEELAEELEGVRKVENRIEVVDHAPWEEAEPAPAADEGREPATGRAIFLSGVVLVGVVVAAAAILVRLRRFRQGL